MTDPSEATDALCLRCDWVGETDASRCPRCSTGLYRPPKTMTTAPTRDGYPPVVSADVDRAAGRPGSPQGRRPGGSVNKDTAAFLVPRPTTHARRTGAVATGLITGALVLLAFLWVRSHTPAPAIQGSGLRGVLVYAVDDGGGWSRLWRWDLEDGSTKLGPRVRDPLALINAFGAEPGMVGVTSRSADGELTGSLLRFLSPSESATPLVRGDLVTWGPRGATVVAVKRGPLSGPCTRHVSIVARTIVPSIVDRQFDETFCGDVLSVGRDSNTTFMTLRRGDRVDLVFAGYGRTHPVLPDHALLSISPAADMLVVSADALTPDPLTLVALRDRGDVPPTSIYGTALYFRGLGVEPRPYRSGPDLLWIDRVLAWSADSTSALVIGRSGDVPGVYEIVAGPQRRIEAPRFVSPADGDTWAAAADDDVSFLLTGGRLWVVRGSRASSLAVPDGAPAPEGPMVWLA